MGAPLRVPAGNVGGLHSAALLFVTTRAAGFSTVCTFLFGRRFVTSWFFIAVAYVGSCLSRVDFFSHKSSLYVLVYYIFFKQTYSFGYVFL